MKHRDSDFIEAEWITLLKENCDEYTITISRDRDKITRMRGEKKYYHLFTINLQKEIKENLICRHSHTTTIADLSEFPREIELAVEVLQHHIKEYKESLA